MSTCDHWRIIRNRAPIGKRYRLQFGYWRESEWLGYRRTFVVKYETEHDTRADAKAARGEYAPNALERIGR